MVIPKKNQMHRDIGEMMDRAGLNPGKIQGTKVPIAVIVANLRMKLTDEIMAYLKRLEGEPKHIDVQTPEEPMQ